MNGSPFCESNFIFAEAQLGHRVGQAAASDFEVAPAHTPHTHTHTFCTGFRSFGGGHRG